MFARFIRCCLIFALLGILAPLSVSTAQDETHSSLFTPVDTTTPMLARSDFDSWYSKWNEPGGVLEHDGELYFFRNGASSRPTRKAIGYMTSADGFTWEHQNEDEPIMTSQQFEYARLNISISSVVVLDDGTWVSYVYSQDRQNWPMGGGGIALATADNPNGPWTPSEDRVLVVGSTGEWDEFQVSYPDVHKTDEGYVMYYAGFMSNASIAIGMATSEDGLTWEKYDDPTTTEAPYAESDPIIVGIDGERATMPHALYTEDGWVMVYKDDSLGNILLATSEDGLNWETQDVQVITEADFEANVFGFMSFYHHGDTYFLYLETVKTSGSSEIYLATHEGSLSFAE